MFVVMKRCKGSTDLGSYLMIMIMMVMVTASMASHPSLPKTLLVLEPKFRCPQIPQWWKWSSQISNFRVIPDRWSQMLCSESTTLIVPRLLSTNDYLRQKYPGRSFLQHVKLLWWATLAWQVTLAPDQPWWNLVKTLPQPKTFPS